MAESTLDSSAGLLSVKTVFDYCKTDDQVTSENNLLLVPQWLYAKPTETKTKTELLNIPKDMHTTNFGNSNDPVQKKNRLSDGFLDKKECGKAAPGIENSRRWQEEERETGLLGRRDRRKEDRHADNVSGRESAESRGLTSSDRWNNVENRSSRVEMRQQSKWSSRWGPEDKERDSWTEKRMETNKEDSQSEKQIVVSSNCLSTEPKTDKWRPRHRLEVHSSGSPVYRAAPGSGTERGLPESSKAGFAAERGRGRPSSTGLIGAVSLYKSDHLLGKSGSCTDKIRYSRQELLDIYRKERYALSFDTTPEGTEEVLPITHSNSIVPWAFVAPNEEEVGVLKEIWQGKTTSSGVSYNSSMDKIYIESIADNDEEASTARKEAILPSNNAEENLEYFAKATKCAAWHGSTGSNSSKMNALDAKGSFQDQSNTEVGEHKQSGKFSFSKHAMSDSQQGTPLQELGDVMRHLKVKDGSILASHPVSNCEPSDDVVRSLENSTLAYSNFTSSTVSDDQRWSSSDFKHFSLHQGHSGMFESEDRVYSTGPGSSSNSNGIDSDNLHATLQGLTGHPTSANRAAEMSMTSLEGSQLKRTQSSKSSPSQGKQIPQKHQGSQHVTKVTLKPNCFLEPHFGSSNDKPIQVACSLFPQTTFLSDDPHKSKQFYESSLVDTDSILATHNKDKYVTTSNRELICPLENFYGNPNDNPIKIANDLFPQKCSFIYEDPTKIRLFYEFILVDTNSILVTHNKDKNDKSKITHSKCQILKVLSPEEWNQNPFTPKRLGRPFNSQTYNYFDYQKAWFRAFLFSTPNCSHSWVFMFCPKFKMQYFPYWFSHQWWNQYGPVQEILPPQVQEGFNVFKANFKPPQPQYFQVSLLWFFSEFSLAWICCWDYIISPMQGTSQSAQVPPFLYRRFKVKWWTSFEFSGVTKYAMKKHFKTNKSILSRKNNMSDLAKLKTLILATTSTKQLLKTILQFFASDNDSDSDDVAS